MVSEASVKLSAGIDNKSGKKAVEYSISSALRVALFVFPRYGSEDMALPEVIRAHVKQELNFSHLISLNENGLQIMLYMTLIVAMLG